jgi:putative ABC transport system permease protein
MLRTHLKFSTRVFLKDKFFSTLNILGLALGIAVSIILLLILQNDLTYDQYHVNHKRIYRLGTHLQATGVDIRLARSPRELGQILKEEFPEVQAVVRANSWDRTMVKYQPASGEERSFYEENIVRTDSTYFQVFTHEFIAGDPTTCLTDLNTLVVTESTAKKYFGDEDPLNKSVLINNEQWKVTAVIKDMPVNTHLKFDMLLSRLVDREWVMDKGQLKSEAFWNPDVYTYLLFPEHYDTNDFLAKFPAIYNKYYKSFGDQVGGKYNPPILEALADIHLRSDLEGDEPRGNMAYLYAFTGIGIFIIILACINYMNLSTAKAVGRATEIAMKKTLGSGKRDLVLSFLGESVLLSFISLVLAVALVSFVLNGTSFNQLIDKNLSLDFTGNPLLLWGSLGIALGIGLISGLYPAFYLPSIPTLTALKGAFKNRKSSHILRRVLITTQFAISIFVVVCTFFMQDQITYVRNKELGFDKDNFLILPIQDTLVQRQLGGIKNDFLQNPRITAATTSYNVMGMNVGGGSVMWAESETGMKQQAFSLMFVGEDYFKTMGMKILKGRDFNQGAKTDVEDVFIANEAAARLMGWGDDPIGKKVKFFHAEKDGQVIGLVKDFNFSSLHNAVEPLLIIKARDEGGFLHLKLKGENLPETVASIKEKWAKYDPNHPVEYFFLDERFNEQYKQDEIQYKLLSGLSYICIFISLLGLLGLSAFTATQRTKEIGIRKVHGASIPSIIFLLYKDVMYLVIVAAVLVVPIAYYVTMEWLGNFAYQTTLSYATFALVAFMALLFAFLTVAFHSLRTARTNPVDSLKYE